MAHALLETFRQRFGIYGKAAAHPVQESPGNLLPGVRCRSAERRMRALTVFFLFTRFLQIGVVNPYQSDLLQIRRSEPPAPLQILKNPVGNDITECFFRSA